MTEVHMSHREKERDCQALICPLYLQSSTCLWTRSSGDCLARRTPDETAQLDRLKDKKTRKQNKKEISFDERQSVRFCSQITGRPNRSTLLHQIWCDFDWRMLILQCCSLQHDRQHPLSETTCVRLNDIQSRDHIRILLADFVMMI